MITRRTFVREASFAAGVAAVSSIVGCSDEKKQKEETMGTTFNELIEARRSVRKYAKAEISKDEMAKIVEEALNAPSWKNTETTRYYVAIGDDVKAKIWSDALPGFNAASSANAAALVAVAFVPGQSGYMGDTPANELGEMWGAYDCGLATSYFILAAKNRGWDTLIMGIRDTAKVKSILGIPEKETLMSVIAVGKSAQPYFKNPRKPVTEVLKVM
ncbi:MAG: nitroreductase family protein [Kiritimatiellae bacterium]|nr:nitroreductase family protein [Kiritimatiellia bacterium]